jgi:ATP-dependent Clp protease protease subunit
MQEDLYKILSHHTGKPYKQIEDDSDRDKWLTAHEAMEYGLVDEVLGKPVEPAG